MNLYIAICLLGLTASTTADGLGLGDLGGLVYAPQHASVDYYAYPRYAFEYSVKDPHTGDNKAQWEKRDGDVVKGAYSLVEPDGSLRVVEYHADDKTGFNAVVKRLGPSLHPATVHAAPIYKAPIPVLGGHSSVLSPISVGPVANLGHLASAPLISGPINGGAIHGPALSTQTLIKEPIILKSLAAPILHKPVLHEPIHHAPIYKGPILPEPILNERIIQGPILPELLLNEPIYKNGPIIPGLLKGLPRPIYKAGPIYSEPLGPLTDYRAPLSLYNKHIPLHKEPLPALPLLKSVDLGLFGKGPIGSLDWEGLGRGSLVGGYGLDKGIGSVGPYLEGHGTEQVGLISDGPVGPLKDEGLSQGAVAGGYGLSKGVRSVGQLGLDSLGWARLGGGPVEAGGKEIVRLGPNIDGYQISKEGPFVPLVLEKDRGQWAYNG